MHEQFQLEQFYKLSLMMGCGIYSFLPVHLTLKQYRICQPRRVMLANQMLLSRFPSNKHTLNSMQLHLLLFHFSVDRYEEYHSGDYTEATGFSQCEQKKDSFTG